jgi:transformation/transcription domain-associated protein
VNEEDMMFGLWRKRCTTEVTRAALSLVQAGQLDRAEEVLGETMRMMAHGGMINVQPSRSESSLWVDQWISCAKALNHWDLLLEYSRATEQVELQADCLWRLQEWQPLKELLTSGRGALEDASSCSFLIRAYLTLNSEGDGGMACERFATQATNAALLRWWQLPEVVSSAQLPLLQTFQQLVEVRESVRILADLGAGGGRPDHPFQVGWWVRCGQQEVQGTAGHVHEILDLAK